MLVKRPPIIMPATTWLEELRDELMREGVAPRAADVAARAALNRIVERHREAGDRTSAEKSGNMPTSMPAAIDSGPPGGA